MSWTEAFWWTIPMIEGALLMAFGFSLPAVIFGAIGSGIFIGAHKLS